MHALEFAKLIDRCREDHQRELRRKKAVSRKTEEYEFKELEQVLRTPSGPIRIPTDTVVGDEKHVDRLRFVMEKEGRKHLRRARWIGAVSCLMPVACGVLIGFSVASAVLMFW